MQRSQEYVEAAVVMGLSPARILMRHIMPNSVGPLIVLVTLDVGNAIITFAGLSFLGLGGPQLDPQFIELLLQMGDVRLHQPDGERQGGSQKG